MARHCNTKHIKQLLICKYPQVYIRNITAKLISNYYRIFMWIYNFMIKVDNSGNAIVRSNQVRYSNIKRNELFFWLKQYPILIKIPLNF